MRLTMRMGLALLTALALSTSVTGAQTAQGAPAETFTFVAPGAPKGVVDPDRYRVTIERWSSDAERDQLVKAAGEHGAPKLLDGLRDVSRVGRLQWPGGLEYGIAYARRTARPDGGSDIVLVLDRPVWAWWPGAQAAGVSTNDPYTVVQLRVDKSGTGEGRFAAPAHVTIDKTAGVAVTDVQNRATLMTDVRREAKASPTQS